MATLQDPSELVPQTQSIADVWATDATGINHEQEARWKNLIASFKKTYNSLPLYVARSPGRVNIIGEHIDYSFYDCLPAALAVDVLVAIKPVFKTEKKVQTVVKLSNTNSKKFPDRQFDVPVDETIPIDASTRDWSNYFKSGMRVALEFLKAKQGDDFQYADLEATLDGNVPPGGGVSSSAAFVCACALGIIKSHGYDMRKQDLHDISILSEQAVGVFSGGMDQAASIFSRRGYLVYTQFFPSFKVEHVPVPHSDPEFTFLVAQSFITSNKAETGPRHYNLRVAECTLASAILAHLNGVILPNDPKFKGTLRVFHQELMRKRGHLNEPLEYQLDAIIQATEAQLSQSHGYTREEMAAILGIDVGALELKYLFTFPVQAERFMLRQRALHCFKEARRVLDFKACLTRYHRLAEKDVQYLAQLLNDSQASCRDLYNCSCPEVDNICAIAREAGALGSRVTGAGWGGGTVHLVPVNKIDKVKEALKEKYYFKTFPDITQEKLDDAMIVSKPSNGSFLIYGKAIEDALN